MTAKTWQVRLELDEQSDATQATASLDVSSGSTLHGHGAARRHPSDPEVPVIGDELAAARALSDLAHQLLITAARDIESSTHEKAAPRL